MTVNLCYHCSRLHVSSTCMRNCIVVNRSSRDNMSWISHGGVVRCFRATIPVSGVNAMGGVGLLAVFSHQSVIVVGETLGWGGG